MSCKDATLRGRRSVYTDGTTTAIFLPVLRVPVNGAASVKPPFNAESNTGQCLLRLVRYTSDGYVWGAVTDLGPAFSSANQMSWGTAYITPDVSAQTAEYGFSCKNAAGGNREMAQCELLLDVRS